MKTRWLAVGAAAMLLLAACNNSEPTPNPELAFCDSLDTLAQSVADVEAFGADATVDEVQSGLEAVGVAAADVKDAAGTLAETQVEAIDVPRPRSSPTTAARSEGTETVEEVIAGFADQVVALKAARQQAGEAHCGWPRQKQRPRRPLPRSTPRPRRPLPRSTPQPRRLPRPLPRCCPGPPDPRLPRPPVAGPGPRPRPAARTPNDRSNSHGHRTHPTSGPRVQSPGLPRPVASRR